MHDFKPSNMVPFLEQVVDSKMDENRLNLNDLMQKFKSEKDIIFGGKEAKLWFSPKIFQFSIFCLKFYQALVLLSFYLIRMLLIMLIRFYFDSYMFIVRFFQLIWNIACDENAVGSL